MTFPSFASGEVLTAADMNAVGLWRVTGCTVTSAGGTAATASNGVITIGTNNTSVTVANAFSADYDNYKIVISDVAGSTAANMTFQFSGITGSVYFASGTFFTFGSATVSGFGPAAATSWVIGPSNTLTSNWIADVISPFASRRKTFMGKGVGDLSSYEFNGYANSTTSATGFVIAPSAGTITGGKIRVYGYRN
jgi:hypothetical protein